MQNPLCNLNLSLYLFFLRRSPLTDKSDEESSTLEDTVSWRSDGAIAVSMENNILDTYSEIETVIGEPIAPGNDQHSAKPGVKTTDFLDGGLITKSLDPFDRSVVPSAQKSSAPSFGSSGWTESSVKGSFGSLPYQVGLPPKESVLVRLENRLRSLEQNVSLSSRYLEELSKRLWLTHTHTDTHLLLLFHFKLFA